MENLGSFFARSRGAGTGGRGRGVGSGLPAFLTAVLTAVLMVVPMATMALDARAASSFEGRQVIGRNGARCGGLLLL